MKLNKKIQYSLLFVMYLIRAGRASATGAAEGLNVSPTFLEQLASRLRAAGIVKSQRGPGGGYSLVADPTVLQVIEAVSPISIISKKDWHNYQKGESEHRALAAFVGNLTLAAKNQLNRKVSNILKELEANDSAQFERIRTNPSVN